MCRAFSTYYISYLWRPKTSQIPRKITCWPWFIVHTENNFRTCIICTRGTSFKHQASYSMRYQGHLKHYDWYGDQLWDSLHTFLFTSVSVSRENVQEKRRGNSNNTRHSLSNKKVWPSNEYSMDWVEISRRSKTTESLY